jgi:hypothetical protein
MSTQLDLERASDALWQLHPGEAMRLPASPSTRWLRLRDGAMWITADGRDDPEAPLPEDWWLRPGETLRVPAGSRFLAEGWPSASFELLEAPHA